MACVNNISDYCCYLPVPDASEHGTNEKRYDLKAPVVRGKRNFQYDDEHISNPQLQTRVRRNRHHAQESKRKQKMKKTEEDTELARLEQENAALNLLLKQLKNALQQHMNAQVFAIINILMMHDHRQMLPEQFFESSV